MSQENVEAFTRAFEAVNRRDVEALLPELDSEVEWRSGILMALGGKEVVYRGHEGIREWLRDLYGALSEFQVEYSEIRDLGERIYAAGQIRARGAASGADTESPIGVVAKFRNGKGLRVQTYLDAEKALEAAGLTAP